MYWRGRKDVIYLGYERYRRWLMSGKETGRAGELLAAAILSDRGYSILDMNFRTRSGEIDLVAQKDGRIHFVEVKTRLNDNWGWPEESVGRSKISKIKKTAAVFMADHKGDAREYSFDVMAIQAEHIRGCF